VDPQPWDNSEPQDEPTSSWPRALAWPAMLTLGWVIYELTMQPALGLLVVCLKFGWEDFRIGWWLRQRDPDRGRGNACFWLYVASGLRWITIVSFLTMTFTCIAYGIQEALQPKAAGAPAQEPPLSVMVTLLTVLVGFGLLSIATFLALGTAFLNHVRLWHGPQPRRAYRMGYWPPYEIQDTRSGGAGVLIVTALIPWAALLMGSLIVCCGMLMEPPHGPMLQGVLLFAMFILSTVGLVGGAVGVFLVGDHIAAYMIADTPADCWGAPNSTNDLTDSYDSFVFEN